MTVDVSDIVLDPYDYDFHAEIVDRRPGVEWAAEALMELLESWEVCAITIKFLHLIAINFDLARVVGGRGLATPGERIEKRRRDRSGQEREEYPKNHVRQLLQRQSHSNKSAAVDVNLRRLAAACVRSNGPRPKKRP